MFLSHKFRLSVTEQMIFVAFKKRSSPIWRVSVFENRTLEMISRFFISKWKQCNRFLRCSLSHACSRNEIWSCCATLYLLYMWVYFSHHPPVSRRFFSGQPKPVLTFRKFKIARHPLGLVPVDDDDEASCRLARHPDEDVSNLFSGQRRSRIFRCLQIVAFFAVLQVDCEEYLCILVGFLPGARQAIVCILFSLEQSRAFDGVVAEFLLEHLP